MKEYGHEYAEYFYYAPTPFDQLGGLWPLRAGQNAAKPNYFVGPRMIDFYSMHFVWNGTVTLSQEGETFVLSDGDVFCLHPKVNYCYWKPASPANTGLRMSWLAFQGKQAAPLLQEMGITMNKPYLKKRITPEIEAAMQHILSAMRNPDGRDSISILALVYRLFALLNRACRESLSDGEDADWLHKSIQYLSRHYMEGITVSDAVEVAGVHRSHFYSMFMKEFGMSPQRYLIRLRMEKAAELLTDPELSITEVAQAVGYPDLYSFSRAFVGYYGMRPSNYRENLGQQIRKSGMFQATP